jgi:hypothetical protein
MAVVSDLFTDRPGLVGKLADIDWLDADSFTTMGDLIHYDEAGTIALGDAIADYFIPKLSTVDPLPTYPYGSEAAQDVIHWLNLRAPGSGALSNANMQRVAAFVDGLGNDWYNFSFFFHPLDTEERALVDWRGNALSAVNQGMTFNAGGYWSLDGTNDYFDTGIRMTTTTANNYQIKATQNDIEIGAYVRTNGNTTLQKSLFSYLATTNVWLCQQPASDRYIFELNDVTLSFFNTDEANDAFLDGNAYSLIRDSATPTVKRMYRANTELANATVASTGVSGGQNFLFGCRFNTPADQFYQGTLTSFWLKKPDLTNRSTFITALSALQ